MLIVRQTIVLNKIIINYRIVLGELMEVWNVIIVWLLVGSVYIMDALNALNKTRIYHQDHQME